MLRTSIAQGPAPTVYLAGEMDLDCADTLREAVGEAARGAQMVVLDFGGVEFIDSSGTGIFVRLCLDMKSQGTPVVARNLTPAVRGVFDMLRVRELVGEDVFPRPDARAGLAAALASASGRVQRAQAGQRHDRGGVERVAHRRHGGLALQVLAVAGHHAQTHARAGLPGECETRRGRPATPRAAARRRSRRPPSSRAR